MLDKQKIPKVSQFFGQRKDNICLEKNIGGKGLKPNHFLSGRFLTCVTKWYKHLLRSDTWCCKTKFNDMNSNIFIQMVFWNFLQQHIY